MSLYFNIGDKFEIFNTEFSVIGISVLLYKEYDEKNYFCEYKLKKIFDNSVWYIEDRLNFNEFYFYNKTDHFFTNFDSFKICKRQAKIVKAVGDTDFKQDEFVKYKFYQEIKTFNLLKNKIKYKGIILKIDDIQKKEISSIQNPLLSSLPDISQFHNDNKIKNTTSPLENGFDVGDGLLINDNEYFVLTKYLTTIDKIKSFEYKLYNHNTKEYCWLKYFNSEYYIFKETDKEYNQNLVTKGFKYRQISTLVDWEILNNSTCEYEIYQKSFYTNEYFLKESTEHKTQLLNGFVIDDSNLIVIKYDYKINFPNEKLKLKNIKYLDTKDINLYYISFRTFLAIYYFILIYCWITVFAPKNKIDKILLKPLKEKLDNKYYNKKEKKDLLNYVHYIKIIL
ncbi:MAG: hypothetical protein MJ211_11100 [Bacteroidales bacterium]|nr:hypothetical protein [Bacteroidales bacterium]